MTVQLELWSDFACPWCYIGKRRLAAAIEDLRGRQAVAVTWRSYELGPDRPTEPGRTVFAMMTEDHAVPPDTLLHNFGEIARLGRECGLKLDMYSLRPVNTHRAHRLAHLARVANREEAVLERLFHTYHVKQANVADPSVLIDLALHAGLDREAALDAVHGDLFGDEVRRDRARAEALGIRSVPTLRFADGSFASANAANLQECLLLGTGKQAIKGAA